MSITTNEIFILTAPLSTRYAKHRSVRIALNKILHNLIHERSLYFIFTHYTPVAVSNDKRKKNKHRTKLNDYTRIYNYVH
jgi:hypothetical protein